MDDPTSPRHMYLSEEDLTRVLHRAVEIDRARDMGISEVELHDIAAEVGISREAVQQALHEVRGGLRTRLTRPRLPTTFAWAAGIIPFALGWTSAILRPFTALGGVHVEALVALIVLSALLLRSALSVTGRTAQRRYHIGSGLTWLSVTVGFTLGYGAVWDDMFFVASIGAGLSALIGGALVWFRARPSAPTPRSVADKVLPAVPIRRSRLSRWLAHLIHRRSHEGIARDQGYRQGGAKPWYSQAFARTG